MRSRRAPRCGVGRLRHDQRGGADRSRTTPVPDQPPPTPPPPPPPGAAAAPAVRRVERARAARVPATVRRAASRSRRRHHRPRRRRSRDCRGRRPRSGRRLRRGYAGYRAARTSGLAIASMVLGIVWIFWLGSILAVIFGHVALSQIKRSMGALSGRGMAIAGLVARVRRHRGPRRDHRGGGDRRSHHRDRGRMRAGSRAAVDARSAPSSKTRATTRTSRGSKKRATGRTTPTCIRSQLNGDPSNATGYTIVNEDRCD